MADVGGGGVGDYEGALARLTEMTYLLQDHVVPLSSAAGQHVGVYADLLTDCELLRVFLLLLLQVIIPLTLSLSLSLSLSVSLYIHVLVT